MERFIELKETRDQNRLQDCKFYISLQHVQPYIVAKCIFYSFISVLLGLLTFHMEVY